MHKAREALPTVVLPAALDLEAQDRVVRDPAASAILRDREILLCQNHLPE
jgi:hypothetical protein